MIHFLCGTKTKLVSVLSVATWWPNRSEMCVPLVLRNLNSSLNKRYWSGSNFENGTSYFPPDTCIHSINCPQTTQQPHLRVRGLSRTACNKKEGTTTGRRKEIGHRVTSMKHWTEPLMTVVNIFPFLPLLGCESTLEKARVSDVSTSR